MLKLTQRFGANTYIAAHDILQVNEKNLSNGSTRIRTSEGWIEVNESHVTILELMEAEKDGTGKATRHP